MCSSRSPHVLTREWSTGITQHAYSEQPHTTIAIAGRYSKQQSQASSRRATSYGRCSTRDRYRKTHLARMCTVRCSGSRGVVATPAAAAAAATVLPAAINLAGPTFSAAMLKIRGRSGRVGRAPAPPNRSSAGAAAAFAPGSFSRIHCAMFSMVLCNPGGHLQHKCVFGCAGTVSGITGLV